MLNRLCLEAAESDVGRCGAGKPCRAPMLMYATSFIRDLVVGRVVRRPGWQGPQVAVRRHSQNDSCQDGYPLRQYIPLRLAPHPASHHARPRVITAVPAARPKRPTHSEVLREHPAGPASASTATGSSPVNGSSDPSEQRPRTACAAEATPGMCAPRRNQATHSPTRIRTWTGRRRCRSRCSTCGPSDSPHHNGRAGDVARHRRCPARRERLQRIRRRVVPAGCAEWLSDQRNSPVCWELPRNVPLQSLWAACLKMSCCTTSETETVTLNLPWSSSTCSSNPLSKAGSADGQFPRGQDRSEWQIEWQTELARAVRGLRVLACARVLAGQRSTWGCRTAERYMVRRRSTVRFRKGAPGCERFSNMEPSISSIEWHLSGKRLVGRVL